MAFRGPIGLMLHAEPSFSVVYVLHLPPKQAISVSLRYVYHCIVRCSSPETVTFCLDLVISTAAVLHLRVFKLLEQFLLSDFKK